MLMISVLKEKSLKMLRQDSLWKIGVWILMFSILAGIVLYGYSKIMSYYTNPTSVDPTTQVLSKEAVNDLIKKAADKKYLDDVFNSSATLPKHKHSVPLQPALPEPVTANPATSDTATSLMADKQSNQSVERCHYSGESYLPGDIVKTAQGWVRCMPTLIFSNDKEGSQRYGNPAWIVVQ